MPNWDNTVLKCNNPEAVKACATAITGDSEPWCRDDNADWKDGDQEFHAQTASGVPHDKIKEVSKQFPDDVITCRYSFECDRFSEIHMVKYCAGQDTLVGIEQNYMSNQIPFDNEKDRAAIYDKAVAFCRRLDTIEEDKDGNLSLNWFKEEVCYKFEHDGADGKKYRVQATKDGPQIDFKVFEGLVKYDWREVNETDSVPF